MRISASSIKGRNGGCQIQDKPKEGTTLRRLYDLATTGRWFSIEELEIKNVRNMIANLKLFYELEITSKRVGRNNYLHRCTGIWNGTHLHSIAEVEEAMEHTLKGN